MYEVEKDPFINEVAQGQHGTKYKYMLLDRMKSDCKYFLGNGNRCNKYLWAGTVEEHIKAMKLLYFSFDPSDRPEWLTEEQLQDYETQMKQ